MRIALVGDLHGNRPATLRLEQDLELMKPDRIICLGDVVGKGPSSDFTFDWAFANCEAIICGNWDIGVARKAFPKDKAYWDQLGPRRMQRLLELPREMEITLSGRRIRLMHGRPVMRELLRVHSPAEELEKLYFPRPGEEFDVVGYADAHKQSLRTVKHGLVFNTGSVGNALGMPMCCYALLEGGDTKETPFEIRFRQLEYDREEAIREAKANTDIPRIETFVRELETGIYSR